MTRTEYLRALFDSDLDAESKLIAAYLAHVKNFKDGGLAFPSIATMARQTGLSRRTVTRRLNVLRTLEWVVPTGRTKGQGVKVYDLQVGQPVGQQGLSATQVGQVDISDVSAGPTEQVREQVTEQDREQVITDAGAPVAKNPSLTRDEGDIFPSSLPMEEMPPVTQLFLRAFDSSLTGNEDAGLVKSARAYIVREMPRWPFNGPPRWKDDAVHKVKVAVGLADDRW